MLIVASLHSDTVKFLDRLFTYNNYLQMITEPAPSAHDVYIIERLSNSIKDTSIDDCIVFQSSSQRIIMEGLHGRCLL